VIFRDARYVTRDAGLQKIFCCDASRCITLHHTFKQSHDLPSVLKASTNSTSKHIQHIRNHQNTKRTEPVEQLFISETGSFTKSFLRLEISQLPTQNYSQFIQHSDIFTKKGQQTDKREKLSSRSSQTANMHRKLYVTTVTLGNTFISLRR